MDIKIKNKSYLGQLPTKIWGILIGGTILLQGCTVAGDRHFKQVATDTEIKLDINKRLFDSKNHDLFFNLHTNVYEGRVMLTGAVTTDYQRQRIVALTGGIPGIKVIYNNVQVTPSGKFKNTAYDVWINTKLNSQLIAEKGIKSTNYQTRVVNSVIYLIGRALSNRELNKVLTIANRTKHVGGVVHHILVGPVNRQ